jgi:hypothetical protein
MRAYSFNTFARDDSKTGIKGVSLVMTEAGPRYKARIRVGKDRLYLGTFSTPEAASEAYQEAVKRHFGKFAWKKPGREHAA